MTTIMGGSPAFLPMHALLPPRNEDELAAAQVLLSVSPACRPATRPRSFSLEALCDVALGGSALQATSSAPSIAFSPSTSSKSFSNSEQQRTIFSALKRSPPVPSVYDDEEYVPAGANKRPRRSTRTTSQHDQPRIGAYTLEERKERIARFLAKRNSRVWTKKVRYSCRKNLAQCRTRVKGRFVSSKNLEANVAA